jgi:hypothetical protein
LVAFDIYKDRQHKIKIIGWTDLQTKPSTSDYEIIKKLPPNSQVKVLRIIYGKDYMAIKVETADGQKGWIIFNSQLIKIIGPD